MSRSPWQDLMIALARTVPPIARLHDDRNDLVKKLAAAEKAAAEQATAIRNAPKPAPTPAPPPPPPQVPPAPPFEYPFDYPYVPRVRSWDSMRGGNIYRRLLETGTDRYRVHLLSFLAYQEAFAAIDYAEPAEERQPYWSNPWLPNLDAICLSGLITKLNPRLYVEVGSGNSTKYVRRAIVDHGLRTKIISIDPYPRAVIDQLCDQIIRKELENCDLGVFADLGPEDVVFIDNSHRSFQNSDVTVFFTEILPLLGSGCHYGIHDIFLPSDYPESWLPRLYNEQYLLMTYLLGGANGDEIVLPVHFVQQTPALLACLDPLLKHPALGGGMALGGGFWLKKR